MEVVEAQKKECETVEKTEEETFYEDETTPDFEGEFEEFNNDEFRFGPGGRGGYRGRGGWGGPIRGFRGRGGFGMPPGSGMRGRGQPPPFFRGRGGGPLGGRFPGPNFDPNWGPPGMIGGPMMSGGPPGNFGPPGVGPPHMMHELWVETKTEEGKSYYYHAITRETTWTRPEGPQIKIMSQIDVEAMNRQQQQNLPPPQNQNTEKTPDVTTPNTNAVPAMTETTPEITVAPTQNGTASVEPQKKPEIPTLMQPFTGPPPGAYNAGAPPYCMPPPGFPAQYPPGAWNPMNNQWPNMQMSAPPVSMENKEPPQTGNTKPGEIDPNIITKAAEWTEHRAPDGRPYYYHAARGESVWEKPQAIRDLEAARMAAFASSAPPVAAPAPTATQIALANSAQAAAAQNLTPSQTQIQHMQMDQQRTSISFDPMGFIIKPQAEEDEVAKAEKKKKLEEKKKKDEEDDKLKQAHKTQDKSRPISSTPISGTPWCVVWTGDGRVFFYNPSTRTSVWERPEDLLERADVDKAISTLPEQLASTNDEEKKVEENDLPVETKKRSESVSSEVSDETPAKKPKIEVTPPKVINEKKLDVGKEAAMEAEVRAARERALVPLEIRVKSFKEMLREKDVSAFSTWEKELHKIVFDPRYLLLTSKERKQVFEKYVKERADEERREKRNKIKQKRDEFKSLLDHANLHGKSSFSDFCQKYGKDDRFRLIEKIRERESLFNEHIIEVRKKEKDDKNNKKEQIKKDFIQLLREHPDIDRHMRWPDAKKRIDGDSRYRAVENSLLREDYFHEFCKIMKDEKRKSKDSREKKEKKKDKERDREKDKDKGKDKDKDKEKEKRSSVENVADDNIDREDGEHPITSEDEAERQQKERDRKLRAELSIKEREKEVQRTLATHLRDRDKEREHHKRDEAMRHFSALLADLVRNADLTWKEVKKQLRKDHRWELVETLDRDDRERLFNEHIEALARKKRDKFREMLQELTSFDLTMSWKEIKKLVKDDPRYLKFNSSEKCEREFKDYLKDKTVEAKSHFRELLLECKLITHKSFETFEENQNHLKEIEVILKNDKRYLVLNHLEYERTQIILSYLEDLHKRGPPPPPTASESTRRK